MNTKKKKIKLLLAIVVTAIVLLNFYTINRNPLNFDAKDLKKIEIKN